ncbi:MAG: hypothetical protein KAX09_00445 [Candidatus Heimdallarchaeota archaeon]|nr:hypothetical protein [Candidatus Heimdallarchaeota archaeon]MCK4289425.1 hypothetical protein [Candidatus Heimdallarchaeota archaeon]
MKKSILIPIIAVSLLAVVAGASVGLVYAFSPSEDSTLEVVNVTTQAVTDEITVVLRCEGNESGNTHRNKFGRMFAYMHQVQFNNSATEETIYQEQMQNQWQHRVQAGKNMMYQFHIEGLEHGMMLQLRFEYNNGKVLMYQFQVNS